MTSFWIIAGIVLVALVALWHWADSRAKVRRSVRDHGLEEALKNGEAQSAMLRNQNFYGGPP